MPDRPVLIEQGLGERDARPLLSSLFSSVIEKPSSITQFYKLDALIGIGEIQQAWERCKQCFERYDLIGASMSAEIKMDNGEYIRATSIEELGAFDQESRAAVKNVDLEMHFLIRLEYSSRPGKFLVECNFRDVPPIFRNTRIDIPDEISSPIRVHIEFPDYVIARQLKLVIDDYFLNIEQVSVPRLGRMALGAERLSKVFVAPLIGGAVSLSAFLLFINSDMADARSIALVCAFFFVVYFFLRTTNHALQSWLERATIKLATPSGFRITRGDRSKLEHQERRNALMMGLTSFIFLAILVQLFVGVMSNYAFDALNHHHSAQVRNQ